MSDKTRERRGDGDEHRREDRPPKDDYESPRVDDIPVDRPATIEPGIVQANLGGSPDATD